MLSLQLLVTASLVFGTYAHTPCRKKKDDGLPLRLTSHIKSGNIEEAQRLALVTGLTPNITSYAGFFTVDERCDSNMFFWFFPSQSGMEYNPVTLWLQGGPGRTSLLGMFTEHGPYELTPDGKLKLREYSWNRESSVLYLDNPVGTGFSFTSSAECYSRNQSHVAENAVNALEQFFELFPNLKENKFFVAGESYAGKYVPAVGNRIREGPTTIKNFEGILIGNGLIDPPNQSNYSRLYYQLGLIDEETRAEMEDVENQLQTAVQNENYSQARQLRDRLLTDIFGNKSGYTYTYNFLFTEEPEMPDYSAFVTRPEIREALHVGNATYNDTSSEARNALLDDIMRSAVQNLIPVMNNYKTLLYYGQLDLRDPYAACVNFIQNLDWIGSDSYKSAKRYIWYVDDEIAGYGKDAGNFSEILVRNAGHFVPHDQPKWVFNMYNTFIHGESLNNNTKQ